MTNTSRNDLTSIATKMRQDATTIFQHGVTAADPYLAVKHCLQISENRLHIVLDPSDPVQTRQESWTKIHLLAVGKAACSMIKAAQDIIPKTLLSDQAIAITNYENQVAIENVAVIGASHPLPDLSGYNAAKLFAQCAQQAQQGELILMLISGGGSALIPYPVKNINLRDKRHITKLLLNSGANIKQINCVRKHLSQLKGGGLAKMAFPADVHTLILSDVIGNDISAIASGPTIADNSTFEDAIEILMSRQLWQQTSENIRSFLQQGSQGEHPETPKSSDPIFANTGYTIIGGNSISVHANIKFAKTLNYSSVLYGTGLSGEASTVAEKIAQYVKRLQNLGIDRPYAFLAGGETTVTLGNDTSTNGLGGRNQEMALAFAVAAEKLELEKSWTFLSAGTDGIDGPTDAAGGIVDSYSIERMRAAGIDPQQKLIQHDAYTALQGSRDLLMTDATGTNVADLQILLIYPIS